ncbi:MAG: HEAT repeat domain-containing protein [Candidatus Omnitrophota bacterium]|nr:MAG: HEAT repeat domain-containing protein [Candidatus Omnitrophota bacterium]
MEKKKILFFMVIIFFILQSGVSNAEWYEEELKENIKKLQSSEPRERIDAVERINQIFYRYRNLPDDDILIDSLIAALNDREVWVRASAAKALGKTKNPRVAEPLSVLLLDEDSKVRDDATEALSNNGNFSTNPIIVERIIELGIKEAESKEEMPSVASVYLPDMLRKINTPRAKEALKALQERAIERLEDSLPGLEKFGVVDEEEGKQLINELKKEIRDGKHTK